MHYYRLFSKLILQFPPETAHRMAIKALAWGVVPSQRAIDHPALRMQVGGLSFRNPLGLAAGFDKNAEVASALFDQGFGFVECGTITPKAQDGNPQPRMFRLPEDGALINRLGFNNKGADVAKHNLESQSKRLKKARLSGAVLGINIGKNKTSENAIADYLTMFDAMSGMADYITLNISSPNTEGLRDLQAASALSELLDAVCNRREQLGVHVPLWLKLAPDLSDEQCEAAAETIKNYSVDALVISNTTIERPASLQGVLKGEQGGLSGKPLLLPSTAKLRLFYKLLGDNIPLVGVGGVSGAEDAYSKIRAGASLVQLYTALGYHGFGLVRDINVGLLNLLKQDGYSHIREAIGAHAQ